MAASEEPWFVGRYDVGFGARRRADRVSVPLQYTGPEVLTDIEITVFTGENTVAEDEVVRLETLAPGDKWSVNFRIRTDDTRTRYPLQVIMDVRAAGGVCRRIVVDIPARGQPVVTRSSAG